MAVYYAEFEAYEEEEDNRFREIFLILVRF